MKKLSILLLLFLFLSPNTWAQKKDVSNEKGESKSSVSLENLIKQRSSDYVITKEHVSSTSGIRHVYLRQAINGLEVYGTESSVHLDKSGKAITTHNNFLNDVQATVTRSAQSLSASQAVSSVANQMGYQLSGLRQLRSEGGINKKTVFGKSGISSEEIPVKLMYYYQKGKGTILVWELSVAELNSSDWWNFRVDAGTGKIIDKDNFTHYCNILDGHSHEDNMTEEKVANSPLIGPINKTTELNATDGIGTYNVIALPLESPLYGPRTLETNPENAQASKFGWHDTDGVIGAEFTITQGNNVRAYRPSDGFSPDGGSNLIFDFTWDESQSPTLESPSRNLSSAITNLFYWNNIIHDVIYQYGFNEASGNFQENNYGKGGAGSDFVNAEAQINSLCNAFFSTPADGANPRMQMYYGCNGSLRDGSFDNLVVAHEYAHGITNRLTGGAAATGCLGNQEQMGEGWSDYYGLILTMNSGDLGTDARAVGTYLFNETINGPGIRPQPYSTDMTINSQTYDFIKTTYRPHGLGSVWTTMLWEMTWGLIDVYGFSPDLYNGTGGNNIALNLVTEALKLQPCSPGFVDGRDAILAADLALYNGVNQCVIWEAFAKRGLGYSASQGSSNSATDGTEAFDLPPNFGGFDISLAEVCETQGTQVGLSGGFPEGGTYSGSGVTDNGNGTYDFDPTVSGPGNTDVIYTVTTCNGLTENISNTIVVTDGLPVLVCQDTTVTLDENGIATITDSDVISGFSAESLTTTFASNNGQAGNMFDVMAVNNITIESFDINMDNNITADVEIYFKTGTWVGSDTTQSDWTLVASPTGITSAGLDTPTPLNLDLAIDVDSGDTVAFYVTLVNNPGLNYTNGTTLGGLFASDANLKIFEGAGKSYPFLNTFQPRNFNGNIIYTGNGLPDNCGNSVTASLSQTIFTCDDIGDVTVTITADDGNGGVTTCEATVTIVDSLNVCNQAPVAVCQNVTIDADANCENNSITASDFDGGSTDPDGDPLTFSVSPAGPYPLGSTQVTLTVSDGELSTTCTATITVEDKTPPTITCPLDVTIECDESSDPASTGTATATENCGGNLTISFSDNVASGNCPQESIITRTWTATDAAGNQSSCVQTITVEDTTAPLAPAPPANITVQCADDVPAPPNLTATDNCDGNITVSPTTQITPGSCINDFTMIRTWTFTDSCGNTSSVNQTIVVKDDVAPVIQSTVPANLNLECADDVPPPVNLTAIDNCDGQITVSPFTQITLGACVNDFTMLRTWTFTDSCGNTSSVNQTIVVKDDVAPVIQSTVPANLNLECADDVPPPLNLTATDNCDGEITVSPTTQITPGSCINDFTMIRTWTFTDSCGNTSSVNQTIVVKDDVAPVIQSTVPANLNLECADDVPPPVNLTAIDNCDGEITVSPFTQITLGACVNDFTMLRTWTFTDTCGNTSSVSQTITVLDNTAPVAPAAPADLNLECAADVPPPVDLTANDNCGGDFTVSPTAQITPGACSNDFTLIRTWVFSDSCGNTSSVSQTIVVKDETAPIPHTLPSDLNLECAADVPPPVNLTANDNCGGDITVSPTITITPGASINDFVEVRIWTFTDACGNSSSISQTITVKDETAPTITCPDSVVVDTDEGLCSASVVLPTPTILDNCRVTGINVSLNGNPIFDHLFVSEGLGGLEQPRQIVFGPDGHLYVSNLILTENGTKGNVLKFNGTTGDLIMEIGGPSGSTSLAFPRGISFGPDGNLYVASQNSSEVLRFDPNSGNLIDAFIPAGTGGLTFPTGLVFGPDNHLYVADRLDNSVRKYDGISGAFLGDFVAAGSGGLSFPIGLEFGPDGHLFIASLNTNSVKTYDGISGAFLGDFVTTSSGGLVGPEDLEFAPDGNLYVSSFFEGKVLVYDGTTGAYLNEVSNSFATLFSADGLTFGPDGHLYASSLGTSEIWRYPLGEFDIPAGDNTITWTTSDAAGNLSDCSYTVTVNDTEAPTITCPADVVITSTAGECNGLADLGTPTFNDNCPGATVDNDAPDTFPFGDTIVTWTVTDAAGNTAECTQKVTVEKINTITSVTVNPTSQQYSDLVDFEAVIQPGDCPGAGLAAGKVEFFVGTQSVGTALMQVDGDNLVGSLTAPLLETPSNPSNGEMAPGNRTVKAVFHNVNPNYNVSNATTNLTITKENVEIDYNGQTLQATTSSNSSTATVSLSLNILDIDDSNRGDIRNATVTIVNRDNGNAVIYGPVLVSDLVIPGDNTLGTISYDWAVDIGNTDSESYTLGFIIDGYYTRNSSDDNTVVTVYKPAGDFITGGGYILPNNSAGQYASTPGLKTNFGFNVKYNRNGKKLKGHMNIIFRRLESDGLHTYQIKGNAMLSLGVDISDEDNLFAEFITKANLTDITDPNNTISLGGNLLLKTEMTDRGEPGVDDSIGINLTESNGTLLYSSNWSGISTEEMVLAGGNIVVHSGFSAASETTTRVQTEDNFKVKSDENPFDKNAFISLDSSDKSSLVTYSVFDSNNKFLYTKHLQPNQKFTFGEGLKSGVYLVIVQQGNNKGQIKMIKK